MRVLEVRYSCYYVLLVLCNTCVKPDSQLDYHGITELVMSIHDYERSYSVSKVTSKINKPMFS